VKTHTVRALTGELDLFRIDEIRAKLPDPRAAELVTIDCSEVSYIDSSALGLLLEFRKSFVAAGGHPEDLHLILPEGGTIARTFEITGLDALFTVAYVDRSVAGALFEHWKAAPSFVREAAALGWRLTEADGNTLRCCNDTGGHERIGTLVLSSHDGQPLLRAVSTRGVSREFPLGVGAEPVIEFLES
jgi:anti-anti-sigma factor